ncbi:hypothetical protein [Paenibacillus sp. N3.4]|uniref:hypothetical protein n=1 Tax=Paenibacillus sp. N3.4 TaxID=2603222 RepID=UPI0011C95B9F|nr:hypothetical protein [Paenibacillus sp. N3.4]TXK85130.1 hypothetical protein FU659_05130 [Paenibacillus sp. N3.4]
MGSEDRVNPGKIDFNDWQIDSKEAIEKARSVLSKSEHDSKVYLRAYHNYNTKKEYWRADFKLHWVEIDPFSGGIIAQGTQ